MARGEKGGLWVGRLWALILSEAERNPLIRAMAVPVSVITGPAAGSAV